LKEFFQNELSRWANLGKPVFVNICGLSIEDYIMLTLAADYSKAVGVEVNISCPNLKHGGIVFGTVAQSAYEVTKAVRAATGKLVIVKLTPNVTDIVSIARAAVEGGADVISLINTVQAMAINPYTRRPKIGMIMGGLSGPAVRPIAVRMVHQLYQAKLGVPIIGMGGVENGESAAEFFMVGANMVAVGTGGFRDREVFTKINNGLEKIIRHHGFTSITQLMGSMITD
jgi:dihydroorotate dehydrogenase (NAD+) catalytic subunit